MAQVTTIAEYQRKLEEAVTGQQQGGKDFNFSLSYDTVEEAQLVVKQIRLIQKKLRFIKKEINQDIKVIRQEYEQRIANVGSGAGLAGFFIGKGRAASIKASDKRNLRQQRDREIQPYQHAKMVIDETLTKLDAAKLEVEKYILDNK